jgi:TfoX/Sxy family transcriptional regulator of competence genes
VSYDEHLTTRIRSMIGSLPDLEEKKMFGGIGFLVNGNMACGVHKNNLIVDPQGVTTDHDLKAWVGRGLVFARTLPPKEK